MNKSFLLTTTAFFFLIATLNGQAPLPGAAGSDTLNNYPDENVIPLGEIVVSSFRVNRALKELPVPLAVVGSYNFRKMSSLTISNVLAAEPGVALGSDGIWSTKVNIRGMNENRLVSLVDGNRIETATDLTASLSMTDIYDIERVEIIKGAQSSLYGTGAMGGIINIITKEGRFGNKPFVSGNIISGYASANNLFTGHGDVTTGSRKWYLRFSGTYNDADDIRTPEGKLFNSRYTSRNIAVKTGFRPFNNHTIRVQYQDYHAYDVGIPGGEAFPGPAEAKYTDISRQLLSATYEIANISDIFSQLKFNYFIQYIKRDVEMKPNTVTTTPLPSGSQRVTPELFIPIGNHLTNGAQIQSTWKPAANNTIIAGIDFWTRNLSTKRTKFIKTEILDSEGNVTKTNNIVRGETPIPESSFTSAGIFFQNETSLLNDKIRIIGGGRFDGVSVKNKRGFDVDYLIVNNVRNDTPPNQRITFEEGKVNSISWSANFGAIYRLFRNTDVSFSTARSFRAPSLEERFKYIDLGNYVRLGDPELKPESGYSADLGMRIWNPLVNLQADVFINRISNMIVETPGEFVYTINTGPAEGTTDTLPALINANVSRAMLYGFDFGLQYNFHSDFVVFASGAFVRGKDTEADTWLPQIPPFNGRLGVRYSPANIGSVELAVTGAAKQDKVAEGEKTTGGYARYDLAINSVNIHLRKTSIQFFGGIDNITDRRYTNHLATNRGSISVEPGRNIYLRLVLSF
ncbi:MAG: TonB-dependent receptor [Bacteroidales bacterium]|nr:TonB-dependent receptor [Bacteroidales bacterium]